MKNYAKKITVVIPCRNEAKGVGSVIKSLPYNTLAKRRYACEVIVIDNNSSDNTAEVAVLHGASVVQEQALGKGNAMKKGFASVSEDSDYVVMIDGDDTYQASELMRLIEPLDSGFCTVVLGSRLSGKISNGAMSYFNRLGNWGFSFLVRNFYNANVTDVLTGYFAWKRSALQRLQPHLTADGFGLEMDMVTKMALLGEEIYSVPISYISRSGESNLRPVIDGFRILSVFLRNYFWHPEKKRFSGIRIPRISHTSF
jgi:glycosyltransferase involved in cell wall biosynthesis